MNDKFCDDLVALVEDHGEWSGDADAHREPRLESGHKKDPTVDTHMSQLGWHRHWLHFLKTFVQPIQEKIFDGYRVEVSSSAWR